MDRSRWGCLLVAGLYVIVVLVFPLSGDETAAEPNDAISSSIRFAGGLLLVLRFAYVWWSEVLGEALWMGRGAWNPRPSSAGAVKVLGWVFLIGAFSLHAILWHHATGNR